MKFLMKGDRPPGGGAATDYYGVAYHGTATTHIDALCHVWDENGGWDGRNPDENILFDGVQYGTVDAWSNGILTRGVLLDVPRYRGTSHVTLDTPVHAVHDPFTTESSPEKSITEHAWHPPPPSELEEASVTARPSAEHCSTALPV